MPRPLWKGAISFGLVHIPVELYPAAKRQSLDLDWLDKRTLDPIGYKKINKSTGREVATAQIVKGYEYEKGKYVVLGDEDFKRANPVATQTVEILAFIPAGEVPLEYFDTPYYLAAGARGEKVYALIREAMKTAKRHALAHVVIQTKQHLALVYPQDRLLMLNTLRYANEIREAGELDVPRAGVKAGGIKSNELKMALRLIDEMTEAWNPGKYRDTYRDDVLKRVKAKVKAGEAHAIPEPSGEEPPRRQAEVIDLVALLRESVRKGGAARKPRRARKTTHARAKRARTA